MTRNLSSDASSRSATPGETPTNKPFGAGDDFDFALNFALLVQHQTECAAARLDLQHVTGDEAVQPGLGLAARDRQGAAGGLQHDEHRFWRACRGHRSSISPLPGRSKLPRRRLGPTHRAASQPSLDRHVFVDGRVDRAVFQGHLLLANRRRA